MVNNLLLTDAQKAARLLEYADAFSPQYRAEHPGLTEILVVLAHTKYNGPMAALTPLCTKHWHHKNGLEISIPGSESWAFENQLSSVVREVLLHFAAQQHCYYTTLVHSNTWGTDIGRKRPEYRVWAQIRDVAAAFCGGMIALSGASLIDGVQFGKGSSSAASTTDPRKAVGERLIAGVFGLTAPAEVKGLKFYQKQKISRLPTVIACATHYQHIGEDPDVRARWFDGVFNSPLRVLDLKALFPDYAQEDLDSIHTSVSLSSGTSLADVFKLAKDIVSLDPEEFEERVGASYKQQDSTDF